MVSFLVVVDKKPFYKNEKKSNKNQIRIIIIYAELSNSISK